MYDPVHGVIHHFYQIHLAEGKGSGPDYGHFVSKDFVNWAELPVALWNGLDASVWPPRVTKYDSGAIFTGSAVVVDGAGPGGVGKGVVNIYPGICNKVDWPGCSTGTLLALAIPADYANDPLLTNWSKPGFNPIIEGSQRDPSTPWKTPSGEWRLRTFNGEVYGTANDADFLAGKWYSLGVNKDFRQGECPSFYPLPAATPGFEAQYERLAAQGEGGLPTHVHKTSVLGRDWWQLGTYSNFSVPKVLGSFDATRGWEDAFVQRAIDSPNRKFYASKDNEYVVFHILPARPPRRTPPVVVLLTGTSPPIHARNTHSLIATARVRRYPTKAGGVRRVNWGWAKVAPGSTQTLPRAITFNPIARLLQQAPIEELKELRGTPTVSAFHVPVGPASVDLKVDAHVASQSETVVSFALPTTPTTFGVSLGPSASQLECTIDFVPNANASAAYYDVGVACGKVTDTLRLRRFADTLRLLATEKSVELRLYSDATFVEAFFQQGRVAMTVDATFGADSTVSLVATAPLVASEVHVYPMRQIWTTPEAIKAQPRVFH